MSAEILDSHVHLFSTSDLSSLSWMTPSHALYASHSVDEYSAARGDASTGGFVFVETDRAYAHPLAATRECLSQPLAEVAFAAGLESCRGIVAFAPVPLGAAGMQAWWDLLGDEKQRVRGVRFLFQDKPRGTMLLPAAASGVRWALHNGLAFDIGVDFRSGGAWQLEEAVILLDRVFERPNGDGGWVVLNHLAKPDLTVSHEIARSHPSFVAWQTQLARIAAFPKVAVKMSGVFSELDTTVRPWTADNVATQVLPWVAAVFELFGPERVMWASDWPVCNAGYAGHDRARQKDAWNSWRSASATILRDLVATGTISEAQAGDVWGNVAKRVYRLT